MTSVPHGLNIYMQLHVHVTVVWIWHTFQLSVSNTIALANVAMYNIQDVTSYHMLQPQNVQVLLKRFNWATAINNTMNSRMKNKINTDIYQHCTHTLLWECTNCVITTCRTYVVHMYAHRPTIYAQCSCQNVASLTLLLYSFMKSA